MRWAEEDRVRLEKEFGEVKRKTDDLRGNVVTKDEDLIRLEEWAVTENLLDRIADAEIRGVEQGLVNRHAMDVDSEKTPFQRVVELPYFSG